MGITRAKRRNRLGLYQWQIAKALGLTNSAVCAIENDDAHRRYDEYLAKLEGERGEEYRRQAESRIGGE